MIRTIGLAHLNLNVSDIDASVRFYRDLFGLEVLMEYEGPMGPHPKGRQVALSTPGARDVLALSEVPNVPVGTSGMSHFGFTLASNDDVDDAVAQVQRAGGKLLKRETTEHFGIAEDHAYVSDLNGYVIELNAQRMLLSRKRNQA